MASSKHIDRICITAIALTLVLAILFLNGGALGITAAAASPVYESTLFDTSYVHSIDIEMDDWDSFIESCENEEYAVCTLVVDGKKQGNVAIRAKGNTSLSSVSSMGSQRYSFKLEFDHYQTGKTLDGLDKLCLNNLIQDNTMMKDYLAYRMMGEFGVDSPLCSFAYLTVNGEDWGLYLAVEGIEDSFLQRNYGSDTGELYKPDSLSFGGGRGNGKDFSMEDFDFDFGGTDSEDAADTESSSEKSGFGGFGGGNMPDMGNFGGGERPDFGDMSGFSGMPGQDGEIPELPEGMDFSDMDFSNMDFSDMDFSDMGGGMAGGGMGSDDVKLQYIDDDPDSYSNIFSSAKTDVSTADETRLIQALKNLSSCTDLENTLDMEEVLRYFVVHNFVCNGDSYTGSMIHNYYLHEKDGQLGMIPWDYNLAYGTFQGGNASGTVNTSIDSPVSGSMEDRPMVSWIFSDESYTEQYHALFAEFVQTWFADGKLETMISDTAEMLRPYVEKDPTKFCTVEEFDTGVEAIREFVTLRAEAVTRQLAGDDTAVDTGDLNLSDMGTMGSGGGMGGGFDRGERSTEGETEPSGGFGGRGNRNTDGETETGGFDGQMPNMGDFSGQMPDMGDFDGEMPDMGDFEGGGMGGGFGRPGEQGTETGNADTGSAPATDNTGTEAADAESTARPDSQSQPSGERQFPTGGSMMPGDAQSGGSLSAWALIGISVLVLAGGLVFVILKKH